MRITKDEAYILACALEEAKYEMNNAVGSSDASIFQALTKLQARLADFGKDERRTGRKSQNSYYDIIKRYSKQTFNYDPTRSHWNVADPSGLAQRTAQEDEDWTKNADHSDWHYFRTFNQNNQPNQTMSNYQKKDGDISVFTNQSANANAPRWKGNLLLNGQEYTVSLWSKNGAKGEFLAGSVQPKQAPVANTYNQYDQGNDPF